ncbi:MAG: hypothetical protein ACI9AQ_002046, partial [Dinoroseobacter sp.]
TEARASEYPFRLLPRMLEHAKRLRAPVACSRWVRST